jgi:hypothetical protein
VRAPASHFHLSASFVSGVASRRSGDAFPETTGRRQSPRGGRRRGERALDDVEHAGHARVDGTRPLGHGPDGVEREAPEANRVERVLLEQRARGRRELARDAGVGLEDGPVLGEARREPRVRFGLGIDLQDHDPVPARVHLLREIGSGDDRGHGAPAAAVGAEPERLVDGDDHGRREVPVRRVLDARPDEEDALVPDVHRALRHDGR